MNYVSRDDKSLVKGLIQLQNRVIESNVWQCCLNCEHWAPNDHTVKGRPAGCSKYNLFPPPEVLVVGCPEWMSLIPF